MNWEGIGSEWEQVRGGIQRRWGRLTDDDLDAIGGRRDDLIARLQAVYGFDEEHAEAQLRDWERHQEPIFFAEEASVAPLDAAHAYAPARASAPPHS